ncbi:MAG: type II secretory pathway component PulF [Rhodothermales bacterium]|jgi:type II secretory pathway component PulF
MAKRLPSLSLEHRARFFGDLAAMLNAGLDVGSALGALSQPDDKDVAMVVMRLKKMTAQGRNLTESLGRIGGFAPHELEILRAGEMSGGLGPTLRRLAASTEHQARLNARMKTRFLMPVAVLMLAVFVAPLPALVSGDLTTGDYFLMTAGRLVMLAVGLYAIFVAVRWMRNKAGTGHVLDRIELAIPLLGAVQQRRATTGFLDTLELAYEAGLGLPDAVRMAQNSVRNRMVAASFDGAAERLASGQALGSVLEDSQYLSRDIVGLIKTGEVSGRIGDVLFRTVSLQQATLEDEDKQIGEWIPRLFYFVVAAWMISNLLGGL